MFTLTEYKLTALYSATYRQKLLTFPVTLTVDNLSEILKSGDEVIITLMYSYFENLEGFFENYNNIMNKSEITREESSLLFNLLQANSNSLEALNQRMNEIAPLPK
ncbi:MAG: hypothetical protein ACOVSR_14325 [Bacteroidia bacterium]